MSERPVTIEVGPQALWFEPLPDHRVDLSTRRPLRLILLTLVRQRLAQPGCDVSRKALIEAAWPGERISLASARNRLDVMLSNLRKLKLRGTLILGTDGYHLDPKVEISLQNDDLVAAKPAPASAVRSRKLLSRISGRASQLEQFRQWIDRDSPVQVVHVSGIGGIGKSTLLRAFAAAASEADVPMLSFDARRLGDSPTTFRAGLEDDERCTALLNQDGRWVLAIDTYETVTHLDQWIREHYAPELPLGCLLVLAGRKDNSPAWRRDLSWLGTVESVELGNLSREDAADLMQRYHVPEGRSPELFELTAGHPLALTLASDITHRNPETHFSYGDSPETVARLAETFVENVPSTNHGDALAISSMVTLCDQDMLNEVIPETSFETYKWLRAQPFITQTTRGLFPHDVVRDAVFHDFKARRPERFWELRRVLQRIAMRRLLAAPTPRAKSRASDEIFFLQRDMPVLRPHFVHREDGGWLEPATPDDHPEVVRIVEKWEGPESADFIRQWLRHKPEGLWITRQSPESVDGFIFTMLFTTDERPLDMVADDPAILGVWDYVVNELKPGPDETVGFIRSFMTDAAHQAPHPTFTPILANGPQFYTLSEGMAVSFATWSHPDLADELMTAGGLPRFPGSEFELGGKAYANFYHVWRDIPASDWWMWLIEQQYESSLL